MTATDLTHVFRPDPPESLWPGRWVEDADVHLASGDPRDWFTIAQRMQAHLEANFAYRKHAGEETPDWEAALILFWGDMGSGVSALMADEAAGWFKRGRPFLHSGGFTFGRVLRPWEWSTDVPPRSVVTGLPNVPQLIDPLLEKECRILMDRGPDMMARAMRQRITEARVASLRMTCFDPVNPVLAYHRLPDYPLREVSPAQLQGDALTEPFDSVQRVTGAEARTALLLTDTFAPVSRKRGG